MKNTILEKVIKSNKIIRKLEERGYYTRWDNKGCVKYIYKYNEHLGLKEEVGFISTNLKVVMYKK